MKMFKLLKILFIVNTLFLMGIGLVFAQDGEKVKDSTDTALVDGVKVIQKAQDDDGLSAEDLQDAPNNQDIPSPDEITQDPNVTIDADIDEETVQDDEIIVDAEKTEPRITIEESLTRPLYQAFGKRDPFKPFIKEPKEREAAISETTPPIKRFPLDEYRIVGIVWVDNEPRAMVVDPEKNTYFLGKSDEIGNRNGVILEVTENGLLVNEKRFFEDIFGEQKVEVKKSVLAFADEEDEN